MCAAATNHYEALFQKVENVVRPHPYLDAPRTVHENADEKIPPSTLEELVGTVFGKKMKKISRFIRLEQLYVQVHRRLSLDLAARSLQSVVRFGVRSRLMEGYKNAVASEKKSICSPSRRGQSRY